MFSLFFPYLQRMQSLKEGREEDGNGRGAVVEGEEATPRGCGKERDRNGQLAYPFCGAKNLPL